MTGGGAQRTFINDMTFEQALEIANTIANGGPWSVNNWHDNELWRAIFILMSETRRSVGAIFSRTKCHPEDQMIDVSKSVDATIMNIRIGGWQDRDTLEDANKILLTLQLPSNSCIGGPRFSEKDPGHLFLLADIKDAGKYKIGDKLKITALEIIGNVEEGAS